MEIDKKNDRDNPPNRKGLVLVVDDESIMRKIAKNVVEGCGYNVIALEGGEEAVKVFKQRSSEVKLVLLDLLMPEKSGKETYFDLKKIKPDVNVILVTGAKKDKRIEELLKSGVRDYIEKPYTFALLAKKVRDAIKQHS